MLIITFLFLQTAGKLIDQHYYAIASKVENVTSIDS